MDLYGFLLGFGILFGLVTFLVGIAAYVFTSLALMTMAQRKGFENPWLAWIPVANLYILGKLIGNLNIFGVEIENPEMILPLASIAGFVLSGIPVIGFLLSIAILILSLSAFYKLVEMYKAGSGLLYVLLLLFIAPVGAFLIFTIRENTPTSIK